MLINIGHYSLIILFVLNIINILLPLLNNKIIYIKKNQLIKITGIQFILAVLMLVGIIYSYIISDFLILNIKNNSHSTIPLLYKITGLWGNHEGSILLWLFFLFFNNFILINSNINISINILYKYFIIQSYICLFFLFFIIYTSNPFIYSYIYNINGSELNPILQDTVLAIHPPLIYLGYIGSSISYFFILIFLIEKELVDVLKKYININLLISWFLLTIGILLGSYWSYYELGWGGWWFWDPVENAALLPWLLMLIVIHTIKDDSLIYWTLFITMFIFIFSLLATFFVRSGILVSVHSFVADYYRGFFIFSFILILIIISMYLFFKNINFIYKHTYYKYHVYNNIIIINSILLFIIFITILIGTVLPTLFNNLINMNISIGISFYNYILVPIVIPLLFIMLKINDNINNYSKYLKFKIGSLFPILLFLYFYKIEYNYIFYIILSLLILLLCSLLIYVYHYKTINSMIIAHLGVFIFFMGIMVSNLMYLENIKILFPGNEIMLNNYIYNLRSINYIIGSNYYSLYGNIAIINNLNKITVLFPEKRYYFIKGIYITKSSIYTNYFSDIYAIIGDGNYFTGYYAKYTYRPLMSFIWIGPLFFILSVFYFLFNFLISKKKKLFLWY